MSKPLVQHAFQSLLALGLVLAAPLALAQPGGGRAFDRLDTDGDGAISRAEFLAAKAGAFDRVDTDGDGIVTTAEMEAAREQARERVRERLAERGGPGGGFAQADADGDGQVSREEWLSAPTELFNRADADGNDMLTREEMSALREQARALRDAQQTP